MGEDQVEEAVRGNVNIALTVEDGVNAGESRLLHRGHFQVSDGEDSVNVLLDVLLRVQEGGFVVHCAVLCLQNTYKQISKS